VVTVLVVGANAGQFVVGQLGRGLVMSGDLLGAGIASQRHQAEQETP
jgi:hypothetical protein